MAVQKTDPPPWTATNLKNVAEFFAVDETTVKGWRAKGMPGKAGRGKTPGQYPLDKIAQWLRSHGPWRPRLPAGSDPMDAADGSSPALERYRTARAELAELDVAERCGQLVKVNMIHGTLVITSSRYRKLGQELQKKYGPAAHAMVERAIDDVERETARFFNDLPTN